MNCASIALITVIIMGQGPRPSALGPSLATPRELRKGDLVRVNMVTPSGLPALLAVHTTPEGLKRDIRAYIAFQEGGPYPSLEGVVGIGHNTPARIESIASFRLDDEDWPIAEIMIGSGILKGKRSWVTLRRLRAANEPDPARPAMQGAGEVFAEMRAEVKRRRRPKAKAPGPAGDIILTDLAANANGFTKMVAISGRFRNESGAPLETVMVSIMIEDRAGKMLQSITWFCQPNTIDAGGIGTFETILEDNPRAARIRLDFRNSQKSIPWTDHSGKDAHP